MKDRLGEIIDEIILENERICFDDWGADDIISSTIVGEGANMANALLLVNEPETKELLKTLHQGIPYNFKRLLKTDKLGTGLYCYLENIDYLKAKAKRQNLSLFRLQIDKENIINQFDYKGYTQLKAIAEHINAKTDENIYNYLAEIKSSRVTGIVYLDIEGNRIFKGSRIVEFLGKRLVIYDISIIRGYTQLE